MATAVHDLHIEGGETLDLRFVYKNSEGVPINLTGSTISFVLSDSYGVDPIVTLSNNQGIVEEDLENGVFRVTMTDEQTKEISFSHGVYEMYVEFLEETKVKLLKGEVNIEKGL